MRFRAALVAAAVLAALAAEICSARVHAGFAVREATRVTRLVDASRIDRETALLSAKSHRAGTPANAETATLIEERLSRTGLKVWNVPFEAEIWDPVEVRLAVVGKGGETPVDLAEPGEGEPAFLAYSPDADLTASVLFANEGASADYDRLRKKGITVRGRIALVRAQGLCRGLKEEAAAAEGVSGLLLYPEPRDQGASAPAFPEGPNTPRWAVPRGSLLRFYRGPGDPGGARARGLDTRPLLPAIGISQAAAESLLLGMSGEKASDDWKGGLGAPYIYAKDGPRLRLVVKGRITRRTLRNLFALLPGASAAARPVLVGNHYDAWEHGAADAASGTAVVLETAEVLAAIRSAGWRPERSLLFAFWDGEEAGLFGSDAWVEEERKDRAGMPVAYLDVDSAVRAKEFLGRATPGLRGALERVLREVRDPETGKALTDGKGTFPLPDFTGDTGPFLGLTTTPVVQLGFGNHYPVYHTRADTVEWLRRFGDPGFVRAAVLARILVLFAGTLATDPVFPYRFTEIADDFRAELRELEARAVSPNDWISSLKSLRDALDGFEEAARRWDAGAPRLGRLAPQKAEAANRLLERAMDVFAPAAGSADRFGCGSLLVGPQPGNECLAAPHASLARALLARDVEAIRGESSERTRALAQAQELLRAAEWIALGPGRPVRPARAARP